MKHFLNAYLPIVMLMTLALPYAYAAGKTIAPSDLGCMTLLEGRLHLACRGDGGVVCRVPGGVIEAGASYTVVNSRAKIKALKRKLKQRDAFSGKKRKALRRALSEYRRARKQCLNFKGECFSSSSSSAGSSASSCGSSLSANGLTPVARFDMVPHQRIERGQSLNLAVVAFSAPGISRVEFTISGQGYRGGVKTAGDMTLNPQTGVYEYWVPLSSGEFSSDGVIQVEAKVIGNDGGIRDKCSGGGGLGLDPLTFTVNPLGTLVQVKAWVAVNGSDANGLVEDPSRPFATIGKAVNAARIWRSAHGHGNNADGALILLRPGNHVMANGGISSEIPVESEWVTVTRSDEGDKSSVVSQGGNGGTPKARLLKFQGITLKSRGQYDFILNGQETARIWVDDCNLIGPGRYIDGGYVVARASRQQHLYYTNDYFTAVDFAVADGELARNVTIEHIGEDAFRQTALIINSSSDDNDSVMARLDSFTYTVHGHSSGHDYVIEKTGAFADYDYHTRDMFYVGDTWLNRNMKVLGKISGDAIYVDAPLNCSNDPATLAGIPCLEGTLADGILWTNGHADGLQWWGPGSNAPCNTMENTIVYNVRITNASYQGDWIDGFENCPDAEGVAFVNNYLDGSWQWSRGVKHLIFWHNTFPSTDKNFYLRNYNLPLFSAVGNLFNTPLIDLSSAGKIDYSGWSGNHFTYVGPTPNGPAKAHGAQYSTGDPGLDSYGKPQLSSPLLDRVNPVVVPIDADNNLRTLGADAGAYEGNPA